MKLFLVMVLLFSAGAHAASPLLICLGAEEKRLHQDKNLGPLYDLNQKISGEMVQIPNVTVRPDDLKAICSRDNFSQSWKLLEMSLRKGKNLFIIPESVTGLQRSITQGMIDDYAEVSKELLLQFISQIQAQSPTPDCLLEEIPDLGKFFIEIKYLQEDVDIQRLMAGKDTKIFASLKDYRSAFQRCRERLKKKARPASDASDKKR